MSIASTTGTSTDRTVERLMYERFSCRAFLKTPLSRETIERMLTLAQRAPSWCNTQPWSVIVTEGAGTERFRSALLEHATRTGDQLDPDYEMPTTYTGVHRERRREAGWQLYQAVGIERGDRAASAAQALKNFELFGAPHVAVLTVDASLGVYGAVDTGVYVGNFLLAAQSLGIGAIPQAALGAYGAFVRDYFQIPPDRSVLMGVSFGYPDMDHPANSYRTRRATLPEVVSWVTD